MRTIGRHDWSLGLRAIALALLVLAFASATAVQAQVSVFQSPQDNLIPGAAPVEIRGLSLVHVGFDNGDFAAQPGEGCTDLGGDEICQWAVRFRTTGNVKIVDVGWAPGVVEEDEPTNPAIGRSGTGGDPINGEVGSTRIATVTVSGTIGDLSLVTPTSFGFLDKDGDLLKVDSAGVVLARAPELGWSRISANGNNTCGILTNGDLACVGAAFSNGAPPSGAYRSVAVGLDYGCVLDFHHQISCWGNLPAPPSSEYQLLAAGDGHMCGLLPTLQAECWGGAIGPPAAGPFRLISRGGDHACGVRLDSSVICWGDDAAGQVSGVPIGTAFSEIGGGGAHTCGIRSDDTVVCWGENSFGQATPPFPAQTYSDVSAGDRHTCAVRTSGSVDCWGDDSSQQTNAPSGGDFESLTAAETWSCGIRNDRSVTCWGTGVSGSNVLPVLARPQIATAVGYSCQVGSDGALSCWTSDPTLQAAIIPPGSHVQIDAADTYACAVSEFGSVSCWGTDVAGRTLPPAGFFTHVTVGEFHACGLRPNARAVCWGSDADGQASPPLNASFEKLSAGQAFTCGIRPDQSIECWGLDTAGETTPPAGAFVDVSAGATHACGVRPSGDVDCWGDAGAASLPPLGMFHSIDVATSHSCGVRSLGDVGCFGGDSLGESSPPPFEFSTISVHGDPVVSPFAHSCGVATQGSIACWGSNLLLQAVPPFDADGDGFEDAIDNSPSIANIDQLDGDSDGTGDASDNCPFFNPDQYDRDGDGVGDICDACADSPFASAPGDVCETMVSVVPTMVNMVSHDQPPDELLAGDPSTWLPSRIAGRITSWWSSLLAPIDVKPAFAQGTGTPAYEIVLTCPVEPIGRIELAMIVPNDILTLDFGPGCLDAAAGGCRGATAMHSRVDTDQSFVLLPPVAGGRADAVYFVLAGVEDPVGSGQTKLCDVGEVNTLATILVNEFPPDGANLSISPELVESVAQDPVTQAIVQASGFEFDGAAIQEPDGSVIPFAQYTFSVGAGNSPIEFELRPSLPDPANPIPMGATRWDLNVKSQNELFQATLGFIQPTGTTSIGFTASGSAVVTMSVGPDTSLPRPDTLYVTLQGLIEGDDPLDPTLVVAGGSSTLGTFLIYNPTGEPPLITLEGASTVAGLPLGSPFVEPGGTLLEGSQALLTGAGATGEDFDGDGVQNETDNCAFAFNPGQENRGGFLTSVADTSGDECQCGDLDLNGQILNDGSDVLRLRQVVAGLVSTENSIALCSVSDAPDCDIKDVIVLARALANRPGPPLAAACQRAIPSSGGGDN